MFFRAVLLSGMLASLAPAQDPPKNPSEDATHSTQNPTVDFGGLRQRAEAGDTDAMFDLGVHFYEGQDVPQDYLTALKWFRNAADLGHPDAQFNVGVMYEKGRGVPTNLEEALKWYRKAADQDYAPAEYNLGVLYDKARGVALDYPQAQVLYRKAADQGYAPAQYNLGLMFYYGQGSPQNLVLAYVWLSLAAMTESGADLKKTEAMRDEVLHQMTPRQVEDGRKLVLEWVPNAGK